MPQAHFAAPCAGLADLGVAAHMLNVDLDISHYKEGLEGLSSSPFLLML